MIDLLLPPLLLLCEDMVLTEVSSLSPHVCAQDMPLSDWWCPQCVERELTGGGKKRGAPKPGRGRKRKNDDDD